MPKILSQTQNPTARLFLAKRLFDENVKNLILTDSDADYEMLQKNGQKILGKPLVEYQSAGELYTATTEASGIFFAHTDIFREAGNLYHIKKTQNLELKRNTSISPEEIIEKLLDFDYEYRDHLDDTFSYKKDGGMLTIIANDVNIVTQIEWFDTEIDAIISVNRAKNERKFIEQIILSKKSKSTENEKNFQKNGAEKEFLPINTELVAEVKNIFTNSKIFLFGGDFLAEKEFFENISDFHFSDISSI